MIVGLRVHVMNLTHGRILPPRCRTNVERSNNGNHVAVALDFQNAQSSCGITLLARLLREARTETSLVNDGDIISLSSTILDSIVTMHGCKWAYD